ncbi:Uncharacterised protein [Mycobacteroides abscessus subsp. abscessus]|nr:Uncharacterised protein [Mycobacteroides abscessus subsp. abscessus]SKW39002.1 Uncharacterised protein [Mycobacteroides abscessus subsp. abscessus]
MLSTNSIPNKARVAPASTRVWGRCRVIIHVQAITRMGLRNSRSIATPTDICRTAPK